MYATYVVIKRAINEEPPDMMCKSKFKVIAVVAPNGATTNDITKSMVIYIYTNFFYLETIYGGS